MNLNFQRTKHAEKFHNANHGLKRYGVLKSADWTRADCKDGLTDLLVALSLTRAVTMFNSLWCSEANV